MDKKEIGQYKKIEDFLKELTGKKTEIIDGRIRTYHDYVKHGKDKYRIANLISDKGGTADIYGVIYKGGGKDTARALKLLNPLKIIEFNEVSEDLERTIISAYENMTDEIKILKELDELGYALNVQDNSLKEKPEVLLKKLGLNNVDSKYQELVTGIFMAKLQGKDIGEIVDFCEKFHIRIPKKIIKCIIYQLCTPLELLHNHKKQSHNDIDPNNIFLSGDKVLLLDFGTRVMGKPGYIPPEEFQTKSEKSNPKRDIYQVGLTYLALLTADLELPKNLEEEINNAAKDCNSQQKDKIQIEKTSKKVEEKIKSKLEKQIILNCINGKYEKIEDLKHDLRRTEKDLDKECEILKKFSKIVMFQ